MAWEALLEAHTEQALEFIALFEDRLALEDALNKYIREMDLPETMAAAVRTRVLVTLEEDEENEEPDSVPIRAEDGDVEVGLENDDRWRRFRPDVVMRGVFERQRRNDEVDRLVELAIARAEEQVMKTHVDNAITFAALFEDAGSLSRGVSQYISSLNLVGGRAQSVLQRTMARLADVHLPRKER